MREEIRDGVIRSIDEQLQVLSELGFIYRLVEGDSKGPAVKAKKPKKTLHCEICNVDGHDKRAHKNQKPLRAFTMEEMAQRDLAEAS